MTKEQLTSIIHQELQQGNKRIALFLSIALHTELRATEIRFLKWRDLVTEYTITRKGKAITFNVEVQQAAIENCSPEKVGKYYLFANREGKPFSMAYIWKEMGRISKQYNVKISIRTIKNLNNTKN